MGDAPLFDKKLVLIGALGIVLLLVVTTPGWKTIFGLEGLNFSGQFITYGLIAFGIVGLIVFAMSASK